MLPHLRFLILLTSFTIISVHGDGLDGYKKWRAIIPRATPPTPMPRRFKFHLDYEDSVDQELFHLPVSQYSNGQTLKFWNYSPGALNNLIKSYDLPSLQKQPSKDSIGIPQNNQENTSGTFSKLIQKNGLPKLHEQYKYPNKNSIGIPQNIQENTSGTFSKLIQKNGLPELHEQYKHPNKKLIEIQQNFQKYPSSTRNSPIKDNSISTFNGQQKHQNESRLLEMMPTSQKQNDSNAQQQKPQVNKTEEFTSIQDRLLLKYYGNAAQVVPQKKQDEMGRRDVMLTSQTSQNDLNGQQPKLQGNQPDAFNLDFQKLQQQNNDIPIRKKDNDSINDSTHEPIICGPCISTPRQEKAKTNTFDSSQTPLVCGSCKPVNVPVNFRSFNIPSKSASEQKDDYVPVREYPTVKPVGTDMDVAVMPIRSDVFNKINYYRNFAQLPEMTQNDQLINYAQLRANAMAISMPNDCKPENQSEYGEIVFCGRRCRHIGELMVDLWAYDIRLLEINETERSLKKKEDAIRNFLQLSWRPSKQIGVGAARGKNGIMYIVTEFNPPMGSENYVENLPKYNMRLIVWGKEMRQKIDDANGLEKVIAPEENDGELSLVPGWETVINNIKYPALQKAGL